MKNCAKSSRRRASLAFIRAAGLPSGAIASHTDKAFIDPYLANQAARGLAASHAPADRSALLAYLRWYSNRAIDGVISDYEVVAGEERATGDQDSQDAYAGTFLSAWASAMKTATARERRSLRTMTGTVADSVTLIASLQDNDGLTWAKPTWRVKYLMDQVEVYWGLSEVAPLLRRERRLRSVALSTKVQLGAGISELWNEEETMFSPARHGDGRTVAPRATVAYPDAVSQLWAVTTDLVDKARAREIVAKIQSTMPAWLSPVGKWLVSESNEEVVGYWPLTHAALHRTGQPHAAAAYSARMEAAIRATGAAWPYNVAIAGHLASPRCG